MLPPDPFNEKPLAATSEKPKRASPGEISMLPDRLLNDQRKLPFTAPPRAPADKEGVELLDGVQVLPASPFEDSPKQSVARS